MRFKSSVKRNAWQRKMWSLLIYLRALAPIWFVNLNAISKATNSHLNYLSDKFQYQIIQYSIAVITFAISNWYESNAWAIALYTLFIHIYFLYCPKKSSLLFVANQSVWPFFKTFVKSFFNPFLLPLFIYSFCSSKWQWICNFPCITYRVVC